MLKLYQKADKGMMEYKHFTMHRWSFKNDNLKALYKSLSESDKETFDFDIWNVSLLIFMFYLVKISLRKRKSSFYSKKTLKSRRR